MGAEQRSAAGVAAMLAMLHDEQFGGKESGRFRLSRKVLREIGARRRLSDQFVDEVADELFELGFVLINGDAYFAVQSQRLFNSYRRVTKGALERVLRAWDGDTECLDNRCGDVESDNDAQEWAGHRR